MNTVDLQKFQFDYDVSWAGFFMNADGTIYSRYGTRAALEDETHISMEGLKTALKRALTLHKGYPGNRALFEGKQGGPKRFKSASEIPPLKRVLDQAEKAREGCVHCHMIYDGTREVLEEEGAFNKFKDIWVYPLPENVGMKIDTDDGTTILEVKPNSPAYKAGLRENDQLETLGGQAILSVADVQWVLHHLPTPGETPVTYHRNGKQLKGTIQVEGDWRVTDISW